MKPWVVDAGGKFYDVVPVAGLKLAGGGVTDEEVLDFSFIEEAELPAVGVNAVLVLDPVAF